MSTEAGHPPRPNNFIAADLGLIATVLAAQEWTQAMVVDHAGWIRRGLCAGPASVHPKGQGQQDQEQHEQRNRSFGASDHACNLSVPPNSYRTSWIKSSASSCKLTHDPPTAAGSRSCGTFSRLTIEIGHRVAQHAEDHRAVLAREALLERHEPARAWLRATG